MQLVFGGISNSSAVEILALQERWQDQTNL